MENIFDKENEDLNAALSISECDTVRRVLSSQEASFNCKMGSFYNLNEDQPMPLKLDYSPDVIKTTEISEKLHISEDYSNGPNQCCLYISYQDHEETFNSSFDCKQKTISDTIYPHYVASKVMGYQTVIEFNRIETPEHSDLKTIIEIILNRRELKEDLDLSHIVYSISGKLPKCLENLFGLLDMDRIRYLQNLCDPDFYAHLEDSLLLLRVSIIPIDLKHFFSSLLQSLYNLQQFFLSHCNDSLNFLFKPFHQKVLKKVKITCEFIKTADDKYLDACVFLKNLLQSFLLERNKSVCFFKTLDDSIKREICNLNIQEKVNSIVSFEKDFKRSIKYEVFVSLVSTLKPINKEIEEYFESNGNYEINNLQLIKMFLAKLKEDCVKTLSKIGNIEEQRQKWEQTLKRNVKVECSIKVLTANDQSYVTTKLCKNGIPVNTQLPVLEPPLNIRKLDATEDSITIAWTAPIEETDNFEHSYRVDFHHVKNNDVWHTVYSNSGVMSATVKYLSSGEYRFRVQTVFQDVVGLYSEESIPISTLIKEATNIANSPMNKITLKDSREHFKNAPDQIDRKYSYSKKQLQMCGTALRQYPSRGPVMILNEAGECQFQIQHDNYDAWSSVINGKKDFIGSRPILLPQEMSSNGVIVSVTLRGLSTDKFNIVLGAPLIKENESVDLPVRVSLQFRMRLLDDQFCVSHNHKFIIKKLGWPAEAENWTEKLTNTSCRDKLPAIILKFSI